MRTLRAHSSNHRRKRFEGERFLRGAKLISEVSDTSRTHAITGTRFEKNCTIRFSLCLSICDYFTNTVREYTIDHALDLPNPFFTRAIYLTLNESCCMIRDVGESAGCARTFRGSSRPTEGRQSCL
jgi:hypothetical protein